MSKQSGLADATGVGSSSVHAESLRLAEANAGRAAWRKWGPYVSERQWGTVREDYSENGDCWSSFPHDHARSRAYRWGEDGLLGISDDEQRLCFALALWNGKDPILKERLFGLTGPEGNHGEDVKEHYFYLDSTPTHSYMKGLYKYPQAEFPYAWLVEENRRRSRDQREFELDDTGVFAESRYFDVQVEYAKRGVEDVHIRVTITNRGAEAATVHVLPTLWFRNTWSWGCTEKNHESCGVMPMLKAGGEATVVATHEHMGRYEMHFERLADAPPRLLFTDNVSNAERLWGVASESKYTKDAFHRAVVQGEAGATNPMPMGSKAAAWYTLTIPAGAARVIRARLVRAEAGDATSRLDLDESNCSFERRIAEADGFYAEPPRNHGLLGAEQRLVARQAAAGLLWSKQFFNLDIPEWLDGDPATPKPPEARKSGRNSDWRHLNNRDIISMPDKWEYPWCAAWDLAFQMIPFARIDPQFAKDQLVLFLREWYMHPSGQLPAYEFAFGDVNPPVHAWAVWRVYQMTADRTPDGKQVRDRVFLARCFQKLLINFTWWVNRKDPTGKNLFSGGFLGLDNIGVFDRSRPLPTGGHLEQADGTAWMAFYCGTMLSMALELAKDDPAYEDIATKFFEHFIAITDAMNSLGGTGLWDEKDGFYYDQIRMGDQVTPLRVRSLVGMIPLLAVEILESETIDKLPDFKRRMEWFLKHRTDLPWAAACACGHSETTGGPEHRLLAIPSRERLRRVVAYLMNEAEFLSPFGVRSVSKFHEKHPYVLHVGGEEHRVDYCPGESNTSLFGGNSNWRGPIWFPLNFLIIEALERYHHYFGDELTIEADDRVFTLRQAADEIRQRLTRLFLPDRAGRRPCYDGDALFANDPAWRDLVLFHEHFHADTGRGLGASHQTGWTALVLEMLRPSGDPSGAGRVTGNPAETTVTVRRSVRRTGAA
ncbi:MAG: glucosidase [Phycisphaerales bacterium]|nr:glucosidase [Phycisphaerales bacterium]